jgi:ABC-type transporter Mla subunit MlaD
MLQFVSSSEKFADATDRFARTTADYPQELSREREAAVAQIADALTKQRQELLSDIDQREKTLRQILADAQQLMDHMNAAGTSVNQQTQATIAATGQISGGLLNQIFWRMLLLIVAIVLAIPTATLGYRWAKKF